MSEFGFFHKIFISVCECVYDYVLFCCDHRYFMEHNLRLNLPLSRFTFDNKLKPWVRLNLTYASQNET